MCPAISFRDEIALLKVERTLVLVRRKGDEVVRQRDDVNVLNDGVSLAARMDAAGTDDISTMPAKLSHDTINIERRGRDGSAVEEMSTE